MARKLPVVRVYWEGKWHKVQLTRKALKDYENDVIPNTDGEWLQVAAIQRLTGLRKSSIETYWSDFREMLDYHLNQ